MIASNRQRYLVVALVVRSSGHVLAKMLITEAALVLLTS